MSFEEKITECAERAIAERSFPGCVVGVTRGKGERRIVSVGTLRYQAPQPVRADTVYDLASVTKSVVAATLALMFEHDGRIRFSDRAKKFLPELQHDFRATIEDLLLYRVKGQRLSLLQDKSPEEILASVFANGFESPPGERDYTNLPAFLLGLVLERISNDSLDRLARQRIFQPLGMRETTFFPVEKNCAPTEVVDGTEVCGIAHDESARVFARAHRAVGHAGLFSTASDLLIFLESLLSPPNEDFMTLVAGAQKGLGWEVQAEWMGDTPAGGRSNKRFGKTGFTGTSILCDVEGGVGFVILSNRTYPDRQKNGDAIHTFRKEIANIVLV